MLSLDKLGPIFSALGFTIIAYIIVSIVLFIIDTVKAKRQSRKIKPGFKIMFIIAMIFPAIMLAIGIYALIILILLLVNGPF